MWLDAEYWRGLMLRRAWSVVWVKVVYNKAHCHKSRAPSLQRPTDRPTDLPTDRQTDKADYRVACTQLYKLLCRSFRWSVHPSVHPSVAEGSEHVTYGDWPC